MLFPKASHIEQRLLIEEKLIQVTEQNHHTSPALLSLDKLKGAEVIGFVRLNLQTIDRLQNRLQMRQTLLRWNIGLNILSKSNHGNIIAFIERCSCNRSRCFNTSL